MRDNKIRLESSRRRACFRFGWLAIPLLVVAASVAASGLFSSFGEFTEVIEVTAAAGVEDTSAPLSRRLALPALAPTDTAAEAPPISRNPPQIPQIITFESQTPQIEATEEKVATAAGWTPASEAPQNTAKPLAPQPSAEPAINWSNYQVKPGDTLSSIFAKHDLSPSLLHKLIHSSKEAKSLVRIKPGADIRFALNPKGEFQQLIYQAKPTSLLVVKAKEDGFDTRRIERQVEKRTAHTSGTIENSLFLAAQRAGLSDSLTMELAGIFGWDIDFALEIRAGDRFTVIYEENYLDGEKLSNGAILAAEFINKGQTFRALRYVDASGRADYYTPEGRSMRNAFLRAPVDFRRISSRFTKARWHPVLGKKRPHRGVDYAAAIGTPIKASGDGRVIYRGKKGGYGHTVIIQHGQNYQTLYAHLSRYNKKIKQGSRVDQGETIGYVGKSGLATGPHLHYEFRVNGVHRNPLTVKLPAAKPIDKKYFDDFSEKTNPLLSQIETLGQTLMATAN